MKPMFYMEMDDESIKVRNIGMDSVNLSLYGLDPRNARVQSLYQDGESCWHYNPESDGEHYRHRVVVTLEVGSVMFEGGYRISNDYRLPYLDLQGELNGIYLSTKDGARTINLKSYMDVVDISIMSPSTLDFRGRPEDRMFAELTFYPSKLTISGDRKRRQKEVLT